MTTIKVDKITPGSGTTTTLGDSGDTFTIPAGVTFANSGSSNLGDQVTYCSTTKSASFTAVANKGYFINTSDASPFLNYAVTVASGTLYVVGGTGNAFYLDGSRTMAITLLKGRTYRFTQTDSTNDGHPLFISTSNSSNTSTVTAAIVSSGVSYYLDGASTQSAYVNTTSFNAATTRYIEFQPQTTGTFYFACYIHGIGMGGAITSQELTVTLPTSPTVGTEMIIIDSTGDANINPIVIGRGGSKVKGQCKCFALEDSRVGVRLIYSDASQGWVTVTSANETAPVLCGAAYVTASGGTETTCGDFKIHTFNSDSNFVVSSAGNNIGSNTVDYLVIAGGGGGGGRSAGGGGAGGFRTNYPSCNNGLSVIAQSYPITVGGGGTGGVACSSSGGNGNNSIFSSITSTGGGGGGSFHTPYTSPILSGNNGGSGGGSGATGSPGGAIAGGSGNTPPVTPPQGNNGGQGYNQGAGVINPNGAVSGGGGGGAGAVGQNYNTPGNNTAGANGGDGLASTISGSSVTRAGGGGAGNYSGAPATMAGGNGGAGGGGAGKGCSQSPKLGGAGTSNTGGGGGGSGDGTPGSSTNGASGGSGVVIIRYKYQN